MAQQTLVIDMRCAPQPCQLNDSIVVLELQNFVVATSQCSTLATELSAV
jgi:hypothetical protein